MVRTGEIHASPPIRLRALFRGDHGEGGPALLSVLAARRLTADLFLLMPSNGQSLQKGFLAVTAEEFVVGHTDLAQF